MDHLLATDGNHQEEKKLYSTLFDLLSFEKIAFNGNYYYLKGLLLKVISLHSYYCLELYQIYSIFFLLCSYSV